MQSPLMYQDPEFLALMAAVAEAPDDTAPRLIVSDWLEENNDEPAANYIRAEIKNPAGYHPLPLRWLLSLRELAFADFPTWRLFGPALAAVSMPSAGPSTVNLHFSGGFARCITADMDTILRYGYKFFTHPILEFRVTDKHPAQGRWVCDPGTSTVKMAWQLPPVVFNLLPSPKRYPAYEALSIACVRLGRLRSDLPRLRLHQHPDT